MRFTLQPYRGPSSRFRCPGCREAHKFTRYIDTQTGEYLGDDVGRCDREQRCGYHKKPKDHFEANPFPTRSWTETRRPEPERPTSFLPDSLLMPTMKDYRRNHFFLFLESLYGEEEALELVGRYNVGTSRHWPGSTIFWQMDIHERLRQCKVMLYDPGTGKRVKADTPAMRWDYITGRYLEDVGGSDKVYFAGRRLMKGREEEPNLKQCLFGEHLLRQPGRVAIVESEKTAIVSSRHFPGFIWLATGGSNGARFTEPDVCRVLDGREVVLFPDVGMYDRWLEKAEAIRRNVSCKIIVSDLLESKYGAVDGANGWDLADVLLSGHEQEKAVPNRTNGAEERVEESPPWYDAGAGERKAEPDRHPSMWQPMEGFEGF
jgi:hypothetical protein